MIESRENFLNMYLNYLDDSRENLVVNFSNITFPFFVVKQNAELSTSRRAFSSTNFHHGSIFGRIFSPETSQFKDFFIKKCVFFF